MITLEIALLAPTPIAIVITVTGVKMGERLSRRIGRMIARTAPVKLP